MVIETDSVWIVAGSVLTFAYSGRFVLGVLGRLTEDDPDEADEADASISDAVGDDDVTPPTWWFVGPAALLTAFTLIAGLAPVIVDELVRASTTSLYPTSDPKQVKLWAGVNTALLLSLAIIATGAALMVAHRRVTAAQRAFHRTISWLPSSERSFWAIMKGLAAGAKRTTAILQNGSLPVYLMVTKSDLVEGFVDFAHTD